MLDEVFGETAAGPQLIVPHPIIKHTHLAANQAYVAEEHANELKLQEKQETAHEARREARREAVADAMENRTVEVQGPGI